MVLLVVDTQKGIVDERLYAFEKFVSNIRELIRTAREQGIEVVYVQHDDGPDRKSTRLNSSHLEQSRMPSSA